jgi:hypothetical protein
LQPEWQYRSFEEHLQFVQLPFVHPQFTIPGPPVKDAALHNNNKNQKNQKKKKKNQKKEKKKEKKKKKNQNHKQQKTQKTQELCHEPTEQTHAHLMMACSRPLQGISSERPANQPGQDRASCRPQLNSRARCSSVTKSGED